MEDFFTDPVGSIERAIANVDWSDVYALVVRGKKVWSGSRQSCEEQRDHRRVTGKAGGTVMPFMEYFDRYAA